MKSFKKIFAVISFLLLFLTFSDALKVLMLPLNFRSHLMSSFEISKQLVKLGHEPSVVVSDSFKITEEMEIEANQNHIKFLRYRSNESKSTKKGDQQLETAMNLMLSGKNSLSDTLVALGENLNIMSKILLLDNEEFITSLQSTGFQMAVVDAGLLAKYVYLLVHRLGVPWISYTDFPNPWLMKVPWLPSYVPDQFSSHTEEMTLLQRIWNSIFTVSVRLRLRSKTIPQNILTEYQKYGHFNSPEELAERSQMWMITSHPLLSFAKPLLPHVIEVGGMTTKPSKKLPQDIQSFLDGAEDGAILLSFGSMFSFLPDEMLRTFLHTFERLQAFRIVWVLHNNVSDLEIPSHIRIGRWLPQNDILGHPNIKLFITHSGNNGQFEALYHGIPMIGFPFLFDQSHNGIRLEYKGYGIQMNIRDYTADELHSNIIKVTSDPTYKRCISKASEIFRRELQRPAEKAAYWIDHVITYGSDHLMSAGSNLNLFQYYMIDVFFVAFVFGLLILIAGKKVLCWALKAIIGSAVAKQKLKKN